MTNKIQKLKDAIIERDERIKDIIKIITDTQVEYEDEVSPKNLADIVNETKMTTEKEWTKEYYRGATEFAEVILNLIETKK